MMALRPIGCGATDDKHKKRFALDPLLATVSAVRDEAPDWHVSYRLPPLLSFYHAWLKRPAILGKSSIDRVLGK
jgi:hypothetical protein